MATDDMVCNCRYEGSGSDERRVPSGDCPYHGSS